jgi:membrane protease subunit HflC
MSVVRRIALVVLAAALVAGAALLACVTVDETQFVLVTEFGRPIALYGDDPGETGLHGKWPWQTAVAIDRRLQVSDPPAREMITGDKQNLEVASYVVWRVADPMLFLRSAGNLPVAESRLEERVSAALSNVIGSHPLASLASKDARIWKLDSLATEVRQNVEQPARAELGIEVVDVRLRRFNHPVEVRPAVFDLIRSERKQVAASLRAEGEAAFQTITSKADRERDAILAKADADAERIRGEGESEATRILNAAHARDPKFYEFLCTLEAYKAVIDEKSTVILSSSSPLLRLFTAGPSAELMKETRPTASPSDSEPAPKSNGSVGSPERNR